MSNGAEIWADGTGVALQGRLDRDQEFQDAPGGAMDAEPEASEQEASEA